MFVAFVRRSNHCLHAALYDPKIYHDRPVAIIASSTRTAHCNSGMPVPCRRLTWLVPSLMSLSPQSTQRQRQRHRPIPVSAGTAQTSPAPHGVAISVPMAQFVPGDIRRSARPDGSRVPFSITAHSFGPRITDGVAACHLLADRKLCAGPDECRHRRSLEGRRFITLCRYSVVGRRRFSLHHFDTQEHFTAIAGACATGRSRTADGCYVSGMDGRMMPRRAGGSYIPSDRTKAPALPAAIPIRRRRWGPTSR